MARITYNNGYYEGEVNYNGEEHGRGTFVWDDGDKYVGEWRDGKRTGQGTYYYDNGYYVGDFRDGKQHGQGTYYYNNGDKYVGEWRDGKQHGQGTYYYNNGDKYEGEWRDGKRHGQGTYYWNDGDKYVGEWRDGKQHGQGTCYYKNGNKYVGEWRDGERTGQGYIRFPNGTTYEGYFKNGEYCGRGKKIQPNGIEIEADWIDSVNANNVIWWENGITRKGKIVNDNFEENSSINKQPWQAWNDYENVVVHNGYKYVEIDGYYFGEHVIARSQPSGNRYGPAICYNGDEGRSIYPSAIIYSINYSISNGLTKTQKNGNNIHYCGSVKVITTADNRHIITVYDDPKQNK